MTGPLDELPVEPLEVLRGRRSAKWRSFPPDVLPLPVAEMDFALAPAVQEVLRAAVDNSDTGYAWSVPDLGEGCPGSPSAAGRGSSTRRRCSRCPTSAWAWWRCCGR